jgi:hypothetical protein
MLCPIFVENKKALTMRGRDGTMMRTWASPKSVVPEDGAAPSLASRSRFRPTLGFKGRKRTNETRGTGASKTDPNCRVYTKSTKADTISSRTGYLFTENWKGLLVDTWLSRVDGKPEHDAALEVLAQLPGQACKALGADEIYETESYVDGCREIDGTPQGA